MIRHVTILDPTRTPVRWLAQVPYLAKPTTIEFSPGLNVLWGPNGSGKSTILTCLARLLHCEQGGRTVVTPTSLAEVEPHDGVVVNHDGQTTLYANPEHQVGLVGGLAGFDYDFGAEGAANAMFRGSSGQRMLHALDAILPVVQDGKIPAVEVRPRLRLPAYLKGSGEPGPTTILLDEPERSLGIPMQDRLWRWIRRQAATHQFIVSSHTFFALDIPEAHYIDLDPSYRSECVVTMRSLTTRSSSTS